MPYRHSRTDTHMNSQKLRKYAQGLHGSKPDGFPVLERVTVFVSIPKLRAISN